MKRVRLRISGGFVLLVVMFWFFDVEGLLLPTAIAAAVHELGHIAALTVAGGRIKRLRAAVWGLCIEYDGVISPAWEYIVILSGPMANFILALVVNSVLAQSTLVNISLAQGLFNLLPVSEMDGGRLLMLMVKRRAVARLAEGICIGAICLYVAYWWHKGHVSNIIVLAAWLFFDRVLAKACNRRYNK